MFLSTDNMVILKFELSRLKAKDTPFRRLIHLLFRCRPRSWLSRRPICPRILGWRDRSYRSLSLTKKMVKIIEKWSKNEKIHGWEARKGRTHNPCSPPPIDTSVATRLPLSYLALETFLIYWPSISLFLFILWDKTCKNIRDLLPQCFPPDSIETKSWESGQLRGLAEMKGICWIGLEPDRDHNFSWSSLTNANKTFRQQNADFDNMTSF